MKHSALALLLILALPMAAHSEPLPPGLNSARLLPGWTNAEGRRFTALELILQPGWKTYWRSPGDTGVAPSFDWAGSRNMAEATLHWPAPELIDSSGSKSFGFHDRLVLPIEITPIDPAMPVDLTAVVDFGLCENLCIPANLSLTAPEAGSTPDPTIQQALEAQPAASADRHACTVAEIEDGMRIDLTLTNASGIKAIAMELPDRPEVWVSVPDMVTGEAGSVTASADFVPPEGAPFDLDPTQVLITLIGDRPAVQMHGCDATG